MPLTEHPACQPINIQSITAQSITINDKSYSSSLIITADFHILPWDGENLEPLLQGHPEVIIIGTGLTTRFLSPAQTAVFYERGIGVEVMTTPAAVRTYTVLTSEDRKVSVGVKL